MPIWAAKLHIMYADVSNVLFVNLMDAIKMMMMMITRMLICLSGDNYYSYKKLWEEILKPTLPLQNSSLTNPSTLTSY